MDKNSIVWCVVAYLPAMWSMTMATVLAVFDKPWFAIAFISMTFILLPSISYRAHVSNGERKDSDGSNL